MEPSASFTESPDHAIAKHSCSREPLFFNSGLVERIVQLVTSISSVGANQRSKYWSEYSRKFAGLKSMTTDWRFFPIACKPNGSKKIRNMKAFAYDYRPGLEAPGSDCKSMSVLAMQSRQRQSILFIRHCLNFRPPESRRIRAKPSLRKSSRRWSRSGWQIVA